ncbi:MAG TPA: cytochrome P450 [Pseudonocardiaceae bacterium]|nr:cytochrome P450 [Pseudonocardiaceae bacterium]
MTAFPIGATASVADLTADPHPLLARLRVAEPVSWLPALDGWLVTGYAAADRVMRDPSTFTVDDPRFSTARVVGRSMLSTDGAEHTRHRGPFARPFRPTDVHDRFAASVARRIDALLEPRAGAADLRRTLAGPLAVGVVADLLGLDVPAETVLSWYAAISDAVSGVSAGRDVTAAGATAFDELSDSVHGAIAGRSLLADVVRDGLPVDAAVSNAAVLMFGGIDTTEGMITNALLHLLSHPDQIDPALFDNAVEESIRLEPAAAVVDRYATRDVELAGAPIRRGDLVTVSIAGANRDPEVFADPNRFDARRANARQHLAFARGPHFCLGADLARLETRAVLGTVFDRLPGLRLDPAHPTAPRGLVFRKPPALHVLWDQS